MTKEADRYVMKNLKVKNYFTDGKHDEVVQLFFLPTKCVVQGKVLFSQVFVCPQGWSGGGDGR